MKISFRDYNFNILFSGFAGKGLMKNVDLKEYHLIKSGIYHKVMKTYCQTYDNKGKKFQPEEISSTIDTYI